MVESGALQDIQQRLSRISPDKSKFSPQGVTPSVVEGSLSPPQRFFGYARNDSSPPSGEIPENRILLPHESPKTRKKRGSVEKSGSSEIRGVDDGQSREHFKHTPHMRGERWRLLDVGCSGNRLRSESCLPHESPKTQKYLLTRNTYYRNSFYF